MIAASLVSAALYADPYELGHGWVVSPYATIGGYFSTEVESGEQGDSFTLDDLAVMAYGQLTPGISYLAELEAVGFYRKDFTSGDESGDRSLHIERLYGDWQLDESFNLRVGKQITPIGYWNREPINVLRDTASNTLYGSLMFPKFLTGVDANGYLPGSDTYYHAFFQATHDMDEAYINIPNAHFYGFSVEREMPTGWSVGGSIGEYITLLGSERTRFVQANTRYDGEEWTWMAEGIIARTDHDTVPDRYTLAGYVQGLYRFDPTLAAVSRYEYYDRRSDGYTDHIGVAGLSCRPIFPVSIKGEYQWHSQHDENRFLFSFSVLF